MTKPIIAGQIFKTNNCGDCVVVEYRNHNNVIIRFINTGYSTVVSARHLRSSMVKDKLSAHLFGVGFIGDGQHSSRINGKQNPAYITWRSMMRRCYDPKYHAGKPTYVDCTVCKEWHDFQVFAEWHDANHIEGFHLDKDLLVEGNKIYSPESCVFVTQPLNGLFNDNSAKRGDLPIGVFMNCNKYAGYVTIKGEHIHLGTFKTPEQAHNAWRNAKAEEIVRQALLPTTHKQLLTPLLDRAELLLSGA